MYGNNGSIDTDRLRRDMENDSLGAFFGGGFGGALIDVSDIENASDEELVEMAKRSGVDIRKY